MWVVAPRFIRSLPSVLVMMAYEDGLAKRAEYNLLTCSIQ